LLNKPATKSTIQLCCRFVAGSRKSTVLNSTLLPVCAGLRHSGMDHTVLPAITPMPAFTSQAFTRWRLPRLRLQTSNYSLLIYLPRKDKRLSRPGWLTYSRRFTHKSGHPSAAGRVQDRESSLVKDQSTTVPCNQRLLSEFPDKGWKFGSINSLIRESARWVLQMSCNQAAVDHVWRIVVKDLLLSQEDKPKSTDHLCRFHVKVAFSVQVCTG